MSYPREIPRDLFNEANLLKCLGKIILDIEDGRLTWTYEYDGEPFDIQQNPGDGSLWVSNVQVYADGRQVDLYRPLNARDPWPMLSGDDGLEVFDDEGNVILEPETEPPYLEIDDDE